MAARKRKKQQFETVLCVVLTVIIFALFAFIIADGIGRGNGVTPSSSQPSSQPISSSKYNADTDDPYLILVNSHNMLPSGYETGLTLDTVQGSYQLQTEAASYGRAMIEAAAADGVDLLVCSAYRSVERQQQLFEAQVQLWVDQGYDPESAQKQAATEVALPGYSEHHTGLCMDIVTPTYQVLDAGYGETDAAIWLKNNAHKYGFILRYPKGKESITGIMFEPWHYRYVGIQNATVIYQDGICLEEYMQ